MDIIVNPSSKPLTTVEEEQVRQRAAELNTINFYGNGVVCVGALVSDLDIKYLFLETKNLVQKTEVR